MNDDRVERLLRGYPLPDAPNTLDRRVLAQAERIFARESTWATTTGFARQVANVLGFGYVNYVVDLVTATDAEYRVDLI
jgi:hypothetical protein